jgi:hypothetical protein
MIHPPHPPFKLKQRHNWGLLRVPGKKEELDDAIHRLKREGCTYGELAEAIKLAADLVLPAAKSTPTTLDNFCKSLFGDCDEVQAMRLIVTRERQHQHSHLNPAGDSASTTLQLHPLATLSSQFQTHNSLTSPSHPLSVSMSAHHSPFISSTPGKRELLFF